MGTMKELWATARSFGLITREYEPGMSMFIKRSRLNQYLNFWNTYVPDQTLIDDLQMRIDNFDLTVGTSNNIFVINDMDLTPKHFLLPLDDLEIQELWAMCMHRGLVKFEYTKIIKERVNRNDLIMVLNGMKTINFDTLYENHDMTKYEEEYETYPIPFLFGLNAKQFQYVQSIQSKNCKILHTSINKYKRLYVHPVFEKIRKLFNLHSSMTQEGIYRVILKLDTEYKLFVQQKNLPFKKRKLSFSSSTQNKRVKY